MQDVYEARLNQIERANTSGVNLLAKITDTNVAIGVRRNKERRILLLGYNVEDDFDKQKAKACGLVDNLVDGLKDPKVILVGLVPPYGGNNMFGYLLEYLNGHKVDIDERTHLRDIDSISRKLMTSPISRKDLVLGPMSARVIPYDMQGKFSVGNIVGIDYLK